MTKTLGLVLLLAGSAYAEPILNPGKRPGVAVAWTAKKDAVVLEIGDTYDAASVARAIEKSVPGASAKARGSSIIVTGVEEPVLLGALEKIEVEPSMDDIDEMLTALQNPGGDDEGSGSSIRATKAADFTDVLGKESELIAAKVVSLERHRFPMVVVTLELTGVPKSARGLKKGQKLKVIPRVKSKSGVIDPDDQASKLNVGAWYAVKGDAVRLRLEGSAPRKDSIWVAAAFQRMK